MVATLSREEKLRLNRERQKAVRDAWARERKYVLSGRGTVDWNAEQQKELMDNGRVHGYEGHHMKSCSEYPEYAATADNIQFLSEQDHIAAHNTGEKQSGYHSATNGYYDASTQTMHSFGENPPHAPKDFELSNPQYHSNGNDVSKSNNESVYNSNSYGNSEHATSSIYSGNGQSMVGQR